MTIACETLTVLFLWVLLQYEFPFFAFGVDKKGAIP